MTSANTPEPAPIANSNHAVWDLVIDDVKTKMQSAINVVLQTAYEQVIKDMHERDTFGELKYHIRLQAFNGRNAFIDSYQELLDYIVYTKQALIEAEAEANKENGYIAFLSEMYNKSINTATVYKLWMVFDHKQKA